MLGECVCVCGGGGLGVGADIQEDNCVRKIAGLLLRS